MTLQPTDAQHQRIALTAALLSGTLLSHPVFAKRYDPDEWGGQIGLMQYLIELATALETQTRFQMQLGEGIDWYLTCDRVVEALLAQWVEPYSPQLAYDLSPYFFRWRDGSSSGGGVDA